MPSLLEALEKKYGLTSDTDTEASHVSIYVPKIPPLLCVPELLVLNDCDIDCAGDLDGLKEKCLKVKELDLAQNKLGDWTEVFNILKRMPRIEFLNLSQNRLCEPMLCTPFLTPVGLRSIVLNGTGLDWQSIRNLLNCLPVLEELHLSLNNYKNVLIDTVEQFDLEVKEISTREDNIANSYKSFHHSTEFSNADNRSHCEQVNSNCAIHKKVNEHKGVKKLHFTGNPVENWKEICKLGRVFPNLETLVLAECPLKSIKPLSTSIIIAEDCDHDNTELPHEYFKNLAFLNLSSTHINSWEDIDRLAEFPRLQNLRVQNWPLWNACDSTEFERRQLLIARLPYLQTLNGGGNITVDEREGAERAFIRYYMERPESERPSRYNELVRLHGRIDPLVNVNLKPEKRIKVKFTYEHKSELRLVDVYRTVIDLKSRLEKMLGLAAKNMRLFYVDQDLREFQGPEEMKFPNKQLYSYNIRSGDEILIVQKNF